VKTPRVRIASARIAFITGLCKFGFHLSKCGGKHQLRAAPFGLMLMRHEA
jgi:hypothetical protein